MVTAFFLRIWAYIKGLFGKVEAELSAGEHAAEARLLKFYEAARAEWQKEVSHLKGAVNSAAFRIALLENDLKELEGRVARALRKKKK